MSRTKRLVQFVSALFLCASFVNVTHSTTKEFSEVENADHLEKLKSCQISSEPCQIRAEDESALNKVLTDDVIALRRMYDGKLTNKMFVVGDEELLLSEIAEMMSCSDPFVREKAAKSLSSGLNDMVEDFLHILNALVKNKKNVDMQSGFKNPIDLRNLSNKIEDDVVQMMVNTIRKDYYPNISHRYYQLKAKMMGVEKLKYWDRMAPLPQSVEHKYTWLEAKEIVLSAYREFSPTIGNIVQEFFDKEWIDYAPKEDKRANAFTKRDVSNAQPSIVLNFYGSRQSVRMLTHELGRGAHHMLSNPKGDSSLGIPIVLSEVASTFGEMLAFISSLKKAKTLHEKQAILAYKIEDMIGNVVRQTAFHVFETYVHEQGRRRKLTVNDLNDIFIETQCEALGSYVEIDPLVGNSWSYIHHFFHHPFCVYAFAFGDCVANSLYAVYQKNPHGFEEKYLDMLRAGGTKCHKELLAPFGLDATKPKFWEQSLLVIEDLINELELVNEQIEMKEVSNEEASAAI